MLICSIVKNLVVNGVYN